MNIGAGDYYSVSNKGYVKHPNVEIIGIESYPTQAKPLPQSSTTTDQEFEDKSIIKEEQLEYDLPETRISQEIPRIQSYSKARQIMEKEEVNSVHLTTPKCSTNEPQNLTHSCIANGQATQYKGILKRSLHQLHKKNINSQQDISCDKDLYLQLEKERRLRRQLEKTYKGLLSEMQRKERTYSMELNGQEREDDGRKRQFSKRTLNEEKSSEGIISYEELVPSKSRKQSDFKTVRLIEPQKCKNIESEEEKQEENNEQSQSQDSNDYRKEMMTQQSAESQSDYFKDQRDFQQRVISQMRDLNKRITQIDQFLLEREKEREKEKLNQVIKEKERQIKRIEQENEELRKRKSETENSQGKELDILKKMSPTSIYFLLILVMAIVAMS